MKWSFYIKRPEIGDTNNEVIKMCTALNRGQTVRWGKNAKVMGFTEPYANGKPDVSAGYINMLVRGSLVDYLKDKKEFSKYAMIVKGWPQLLKEAPKRYPGT